jgi:hypothetical protein
MGSVTDNLMWDLFTMAITAATQVTITVIATALVASDFDDSLRALISSDFGG